MTLMLRFKVAPKSREALQEFVTRATPYYEQPGGIRVRLLQCVKSPNEFVEIIEYRDQETYQRDQVRIEQDPVMKSLLAEWRQFHVAPVSVDVYSESSLARPDRPE